MIKYLLIVFLSFPIYCISQVNVYTKDNLGKLKFKETCESFKVTFKEEDFELELLKICNQDTLFRVLYVTIFQIDPRKSIKYAQLTVFENDIAISSIDVFKESATINYENRKSEVIKGKSFYQNIFD